MRLIFTVICLLLMLACKKSDNNEGSSDLKKFGLLVDKKWMIIEGRLRDSSGVVSDDYWPMEHPSFKDDYIIWNSNLTYRWSDSTIRKPFSTGPVDETGTWNLTNSMISMTSDQGSHTSNLKITSISSGRLNVEFPRAFLPSNPDPKETVLWSLIPVQ